MTDRETLFTFRLKQAEETLADARTMLADHKTSKHAGIISLFDRMIVHPRKLGREYSRMLHRLFDARQGSGTARDL